MLTVFNKININPVENNQGESFELPDVKGIHVGLSLAHPVTVTLHKSIQTCLLCHLMPIPPLFKLISTTSIKRNTGNIACKCWTCSTFLLNWWKF